MSIDVQMAAAPTVDVESPVGRPCYAATRAEVGVVTAVAPDGALTIAFPGGSTVPVAADGAVVLPQVGEFVEVPGDGEEALQGFWAGLVPPREYGGPVTVRVVVGAEVLECRTEPLALRACRVLSGPADPSVAGVVWAVAQVCALLDVERRERAVWKAALNEAACERADEQNWCSDFDGFMNDWGMPGRRRAYDVEVEVTGTVLIRVDAATSSDAEQAVTRAQVIEAARERLDALDFEVRDAEEA